jgi:hypothetical protein
VQQEPSFPAKADPSYFHIVSCAHSLHAATMEASSAVSASEVFLRTIAIRLAAMALLSLASVVLPPGPHDRQLACLGPDFIEPQLQAAPAAGQLRVNNETLGEMIPHD